MYTSINNWKRNEKAVNEDNLPEDIDNPGNEVEETEETDEQLTFEDFKSAIVAEHEKQCEETDEEDEACDMLDDEQLNIAYDVCLTFCSESPTESDVNDEDTEEEGEMDEDEFQNEMNEMFDKFKKKNKKGKRAKGHFAYSRTIEYIEGDSEEAKKSKEYYEKYLKDVTDSEIRKSTKLLKITQQITNLGFKWARKNKMTPKDYSYREVKTVLEEDYNRVTHGGPNLMVGESKKNKK